MSGGFTASGVGFVNPSGAFVFQGGLGLGRPPQDFELGGGGPLPFGPTIDLNFASNAYYGVTGAPTSFLTTTGGPGTAVDSNGNWRSFAANTPRIMPGTGLLIEESRTNGIRNNTMQGASIGTPGVTPSNWLLRNNTGLSTQVVAVGTNQGINTMDLRFFGTASGAGVLGINFEASTIIAAVTGQAWAQTAFIAIVGGTTTNTGTVSLGTDEDTSGGVFIRSNLGTVPLTSTLTRVTNLFTTGGGVTTAFVLPYFQLAVNGAGAVDITLRIGWPQLELGAFATSPIPTTSAAVTRATDLVTLTSLPTFGAAYSLFGFGTPQSPTTSGNPQVLVSADDGTTNNRIITYRSQPAALSRMNVEAAGVALLDYSPPQVWQPNTPGKMGVSYAVGSQIGVYNGGTPGTATSAAVPAAFSGVHIGSHTNTFSWDGTISWIAIWTTTALTAGQLQQITT